METALASTRAERSLYSDRPWAGGRFKKFSGPPDGWVFSETLGRWADPPACWKFSGRYWIRNPNCRNWISSTCKRGSGCQYYHPPRSECSSTSQTRVATPNCDFDSKSRTNTSHAEDLAQVGCAPPARHHLPSVSTTIGLWQPHNRTVGLLPWNGISSMKGVSQVETKHVDSTADVSATDANDKHRSGNTVSTKPPKDTSVEAPDGLPMTGRSAADAEISGTLHAKQIKCESVTDTDFTKSPDTQGWNQQSATDASRERAKATENASDVDGTTATLVTASKDVEDLDDEEADLLAPSVDEVPAPASESSESYIKRILGTPGFEDSGTLWDTIKKQTQLLQRQGVDLKEECSNQHIALTGKEDLQPTKAIENYYNYLRAAGFLPQEARYICCDAGSCGCYTCSPYDLDPTDCITKSSRDVTTGLLLVSHANKLCVTSRTKLQELVTGHGGLIVVLYNSQKTVSESLRPLFTAFNLSFDFLKDYGIDSLDKALTTFQDLLNAKFKGNQMKLQGGLEGPFVRFRIRQILTQHEKTPERVKNALEVLLNDACKRQRLRLIQKHKFGECLDGAEAIQPDEHLLSSEDLIGPSPDTPIANLKEWHELQQMIGLADVKMAVETLVSGLTSNHYRALHGREALQISMSKLFLGPPGTGKTTVAKLYGAILAKIGYLSKGQLIIKNANAFIASYIGQSAERTRTIIQEAAGNVLLIDEAYMLNAARNADCPFRKEVLDTLTSEVQNKPGEDICVVMCGYKSEMEALIRESNPGLQRRFPLNDAFIFTEFNQDELLQIFDAKMKALGIRATIEAREIVKSKFQLARQSCNFGNGGEVDNLLSQAIQNSWRRFGKIPDKEKFEYSRDIELLAEDFDTNHQDQLTEENMDELFADMFDMDNHVERFRSILRQRSQCLRRGLDAQTLVPFTFVLIGPAGCGKTSAARKIGEMYHRMGVLASCELVEISIREMHAAYASLRPEKNQELIQKALGKVLLVDDAHRLDDEEHKLYANQIRHDIAEAASKPQNQGKIVVIIAGNESVVDATLGQNSILATHFRTRVKFDKLSSHACFQLLKSRMRQRGVKVNLSGPHIEPMFDKLRSMKSWSNGYDVQALADEISMETLGDASEDEEPLATEDQVLDIMWDWIIGRGHLGSRRTDDKLDDLPSCTCYDFQMKANKRQHRDTQAQPSIPEENTTNERTRLYRSVRIDRKRQETRLITILKGDDDSLIRCTMRQASLLDPPQYCCLSYVWGEQNEQDPKVNRTIQVNDFDVVITKNLEAALRKLREFVNDGRKLEFWVDALSINQKDLDEKSYQIPLMKKIFSTAEHVFGWLGDEASSDSTFRMAKRILYAQRVNQLDNTMLVNNYMIAHAVNAHAFWERLWIFQELCLPKKSPILLARNMHICMDHFLQSAATTIATYGRGKVLHSDFDHMYLEPDTAEKLANDGGNTVRRALSMLTLERMRKAVQASEEKKVPLVLLSSAALIGATTVPADRIYALLGLMDQSQQNRIKVDYGEKGHLKAYKAFFQMIWTSSEPRALQTAIFSRDTSANDFPSWVPDISQHDFASGSMPRSGGNPFTAGRPAKVESDFFIKAGGVNLGTVIACNILGDLDEKTAFANFPETTLDACYAAQAMVNDMFVKVQDMQKQEPSTSKLGLEMKASRVRVFEALMDTSGVDSCFSCSECTFAMTRNRFKTFWDDVVAEVDPNEHLRDFNAEQVDPNASVAYICSFRRLARALCAVALQSSIILTSEGMIFIGPQHCKSDDVLCLLHGFEHPLVLRLSESGSSYRIVGFASMISSKAWTKIQGQLEALDASELEDFRIG